MDQQEANDASDNDPKAGCILTGTDGDHHGAAGVAGHNEHGQQEGATTRSANRVCVFLHRTRVSVVGGLVAGWIIWR